MGLLMSFAKRPDRFSDEMIDAMRRGVTYPELMEIAAWVGLPKSTAARLVHSRTRNSAPSQGLSARFGRHLIGILVVFVAGATLVNIFLGESWVRVVVLAAVFSMIAYGLYSLIARISTD